MQSVKGTVNYVEVIGWLGNDPDERVTPGGVPISLFSLGTKRPSAKQEDGTWLYDTEWIDVEAFDKLADTANMSLKKGSRVRVTGSLRSHTWEDKNGQKHKSTVVRAEDVMFLDARQTTDDASVAGISE